MIVVEPTSGLCSRIYVLNDAYILAKKYRQKLVVIWTKTTDCNIGYYRVFDKSQFADIDIKIIELTKFRIRFRDIKDEIWAHLKDIFIEVFVRLSYIIKHSVIKKYYRTICDVYKNAYSDGNAPIDESKIENHNVYIEAYNSIIGKDMKLDAIKIRQELILSAENIIGKYKENCIGIHIRRTDHGPAKEHSRTEIFLKKIDEIIQQDNKVCFFLATDEWKEEYMLKERYQHRIICQDNKVLNRYTEEGMISSIIDFLCLSKTKYILGSYTSIFSKFSAQYGNVDLIIM